MWLSVHDADGAARTVHVAEEKLVIGRDEGADVALDDEQAARRHASLEPLPDGRAILTDLDSTNGTFVGGNRIDSPTILTGGEEIRIGSTTLTASAEEPIEHLQLEQPLRRRQIMAVALGVFAIAGIAIGILFAARVFGSDDRPSAADVVEAATPSTLLLRGEQDGQTFGAGTGWVYDAEEGLVVTNAHVVNTYPKFTVSLGSEKSERDAEIVSVAPCDDLAVLRVDDTTGFASMPLGSQAEVERGQEVVALGYPVTSAAGSDLGGAIVATDGVVSIVSTPADAYPNLLFPNVIRTDAAIDPGNSGGPLLDLDGQLVGVSTFVSNTRQAQNLAVGVDRVKELVPRMVDGTSIGWSGLGFYEPTSPDELRQLGLPEFEGLVITNAKPGTFAADSGLGDGPFLVVAINGNPIDTTLRSYCNEVGDLRRDESAVFTIFAPGSEEPQDVTVRFN